MNKIDRRHVYGIMIDTETANTIQNGNNLDMTNVLPYDIGWAVIDSHGRVYETYSFVNRDIFVHERKLMESAYYANKIPQYVEDLRNGKRKMASTYEIRSALLDCIDRYGCQFVCAHNARFDYNALNNVQRWTTQSKYRYFLPFGLEWWDTLRMARDVILPMPTYIRFCEENGYCTKTGKPRATAEILYRFISGNNDFTESHTGLEDVTIEAQILAYCVRRHKSMERRLFPNQKEPAPAPTDFQKEIMKIVKNNV